MESLQARGFSLTADNDTLCVSPADRLSDADRQAIRQYKWPILSLLRQNVTNVTTSRQAQPSDVGFSPEDVAWTEAALSRHYGCPVRLYTPAEFANLERQEESP
jgi:hypothetical protein